MNKNFETNIINIYGTQGKQWLLDLPSIVAKIAKEWNLTDLKPIDNLSMNYVASGLQDTQEIILKLSLDSDLIFHEKTALTSLAGYGAVPVLAYQTRALLLKKLSPATSLKTYLPDRQMEALKIACEVTRKLHQAPLPQNIKLPSIEERFSLLDKNWPIPNDYLNLARQFRDHIFYSYHERRVLHGDLHHDNILSDSDTWKVIDPHGVVGFPINEVWAFVQDIDNDIPFIAKYFGFPIDDVQKFYFMHSVLSSIWAVEDNMDPTFWLVKAERLEF
ncbi:MAG: aminoglycoside phosphotransferase family protein [Pseudomonadota bacterium]